MKTNSAYTDFCLLRQAMIAEWRAWIAEHPPESDIQDELDATRNALLQLAMIGPRHA